MARNRDANGEFEVTGLAAGSYTISAYAELKPTDGGTLEPVWKGEVLRVRTGNTGVVVRLERVR